jgi:hypothetical protein
MVCAYLLYGILVLLLATKQVQRICSVSGVEQGSSE